MLTNANHTPSTGLLKEVRAALVLRDSSLSAISAEFGVKRQNLTKALVGEWTGPKADKLVRAVVNSLAQGATE